MCAALRSRNNHIHVLCFLTITCNRKLVSKARHKSRPHPSFAPHLQNQDQDNSDNRTLQLRNLFTPVDTVAAALQSISNNEIKQGQ